MKEPPPDELLDESNYKGFVIRQHRRPTSDGYMYIVCFNLRDGNLLEEENGISIQDKLTALITETDLLAVFGRKMWRTIRIGPCRIGRNEPVIALTTIHERFFPGLVGGVKKVIDRYQDSLI